MTKNVTLLFYPDILMGCLYANDAILQQTLRTWFRMVLQEVPTSRLIFTQLVKELPAY
jgi:hypothetical protein